MRSPRRTAQTGAALMVGLALVSTIAVFGASVSRSTTSSVDEAIRADYIVTTSSGGGGTGEFSAATSAAVHRVPGVTAVSTVYSGVFQFRGSLSNLTAVSPDRLSQTLILRMTDGTAAPSLTAGDLLIDTTTANSDHLTVGSEVRVKFARTGNTRLRVGGIFNSLFGSLLVSDQFYRSHFDSPLPVALPHAARPPGPAPPARHRSRPGWPPTPVSPSRPRPSSSRPSRSRSTNCSAWSMPSSPWPSSSPDRHREHPHALGVRTHPRDRSPARRRHAPAPDQGHDPFRGRPSCPSSVPSSASWSEPASGWPSPSPSSSRTSPTRSSPSPISSCSYVIAALLGLGAANWPARHTARPSTSWPPSPPSDGRGLPGQRPRRRRDPIPGAKTTSGRGCQAEVAFTTDLPRPDPAPPQTWPGTPGSPASGPTSSRPPPLPALQGTRPVRRTGIPGPVDWWAIHKGVIGFDSGRRCGRSEPWFPEPR